MIYIITLSGGKDSLATAIWAKKNLAGKKLVYVFCDTGWESVKTYQHLKDIERDLEIEITTLTNPKFENLVDLFIKKKRSASTKARFCTEELKVKPMLDYVLSIKEDVTVIQGVRAEESEQRKAMKEKDEYFRFYFEPYGYDKKGKPKYHTYRKNDVLSHCDQHSVDVLRPILQWSVAVRQLMELYPERIDEIRDLERRSNSTFFPPNYIPAKYCTKKCVSKKTGKYTKAPTIDDVLKYLVDDPNQGRLFTKVKGCASVYNICERAS